MQQVPWYQRSVAEMEKALGTRLIKASPTGPSPSEHSPRLIRKAGPAFRDVLSN